MIWLDSLTFYLAYFLMHKPIMFLCWFTNRLSLVLFRLAFVPVRPWMRLAPVNDNNGGSNDRQR